jgi:hypothetical protein
MPRKLRNPKQKYDEISETALWHLGDQKLYPEPATVDRWELLMMGGPEIAALWREYGPEILKDWIAKFPGTRPQSWWDVDAPRMSDEEIRRHGWADTFFTDRIAAPRLRLGGTGDPAHEHLGLVPDFDCGVPVVWLSEFDALYYRGRATDVAGNRIGTQYRPEDFAGVAIDPRNPPKYESQASYLRRHNLFAPGEERRLKPEDFEPETVEIPEDENKAITNLAINTPRRAAPGTVV